MSECYYCHWGWPKEIVEIFHAAIEKLNGDQWPLRFGPAHIVWDDENFDSAQWCLDHFDEFREDLTTAELEVVRWSLERLRDIYDPEKHDPPRQYDGENPGEYPPSWEPHSKVSLF